MPGLPEVDVAVVGGGVGGIYTAWRLATSQLGSGSASSWAEARGGRLSVALYEGSDRIGGRLLSARSPHRPDTTAEIGGMRYVYPAQKLMTGLVEKVLQLPIHQQVVDLDSNIAFLRGRLLRTAALGNPAVLPYWFDPSEAAWLAARASAPPGLIVRELTRLMPEIPDQLKKGTLRPYLESIVIDGLPLWQHGFWNLLAKYISTDAYNAARETIGYDCLGGNGNALDLTTEFFDFTPGIKYRMVNEGYEAVPWQLQQRFVAAGGKIHFGCWLDWFAGATLADGSQGVELLLRDRAPITARAVVLAMPRRAIELLRPEGEVLRSDNADFRHNLAAVSGIPLFKLFMVYPQCWWQDVGVKQGRSLTDLPLRQCYYWPCGSDGTGIPGRNEPGLVMAYDDLLNVDFWHGLDVRPEVHKAGLKLGIRRPDSHNAVQMFAPLPPGPQVPPTSDNAFADRLRCNWEQHGVTQAMRNELHRQLLAMHGVDSAPEPIDAAFMDWSSDPYGGGVHLWNANYDSAKLVTHMTQPVEGFPCYLCGEAYSTNQTWAEGALRTAEIVLQKRLGLPEAEWQR